ncbi:MAG: acylphosphatase [Bacteroidales bacterium]|nr:acylphosphatase [Bacteroidales bacterium]
MKKTVSIKISGKVQGVGFRYYTKKKAKECHVNGFVQNKPDGSVYIEAHGEKIDVDTFIDWCKRGPDWARVLESRISELPNQKWDGFEVK